MTRRLWLAWPALMLPGLMLAGCHGSPPKEPGDGSTGGAGPVPIVQATPAPIVTPAPVVNAATYLAKASANDLFQIESSRAILNSTTKADIRALALKVIDAHEQSARQIAQAAQAAGMTPPPPAMPADRQQQLDGIRKASGVAADHLYIDDQRSAQVEALAIHKSYAADGDNQPLRAAAAGIAGAVQHNMDSLAHVKRE